ncbi:hypothetical protein AGR4C_pa70058 [Agrobacterium tumefaciens str. Kerr 14]|uniref:Uncharacterized protein n=1 Tax=Agrobacterium tumefaciens str. Kerr 14 TaxID=1183424 RepID=A0A1S7SCJ9_AGRTU|nr:hypothetical protein AGR4C_pa70058 [Agrobacterium tumefaciens str. Kerr 14]
MSRCYIVIVAIANGYAGWERLTRAIGKANSDAY